MRTEDREPAAILAAVCAVLAWSGARPKDRVVWLLEVFPVIAGAGLLLATYRRFRWTPLAYRLTAVFALVIMVGGKYTYAEVPVGFWVRDALGLARNHYDRLGHFLQGVVPAILAREFLLRTTPLKPGKLLFWLCCSVALSISAFYEFFEWWTALVADPQAGTAFLGTQGDVWDTQWDMFMALCGSILVQAAFYRLHDRQLAALEPLGK